MVTGALGPALLFGESPRVEHPPDLSQDWLGAAGRPGGLAFNVENARFSDAQGGGCGSAGLHHTVA